MEIICFILGFVCCAAVMLPFMIIREKKRRKNAETDYTDFLNY